MPEHLPALPARFFRALKTSSFQDIALEIASHFFGNDIRRDDLRRMIDHTVQFDVPLVEGAAVTDVGERRLEPLGELVEHRAEATRRAAPARNPRGRRG